MPLNAYGVLKGTVLDRRAATAGGSGHHHLLCGAGRERWRIAVNARSELPPSDVAYAAITPFAHPLLATLERLADGWHLLRPTAGLDYVRGGLCRPAQFQPLPATRSGAGNDLNELFEARLPRDARVYAFGEPWGPDRAADPSFGFQPGRGVHDIHQNQGNSGRFRADDGAWQDGGLLVKAGGTWTAILLRFQWQAWKTDAAGHVLR